MKRLSNLFKVNPIVVKEVRSRMRGPRAFITLTLILLGMGGVMYGMLQLIMAGARYSNVLSPQVGQGLFAALAFLELFMISAVTPAVTSGAISGEKEKQTYEMLMATPLSGTSILWGKLISALSYVFLLLFAAIPLASIVFIFGGVSPREMVKALLVLLAIAVAFGILGMFLSSLFGRTGRATIASFLIVTLLMFGPLFLAGIIGAIQQREPPRMVLAPSPISALASTLAPTMGMEWGGSLFYILGGMFNLGMAPISQASIPRPMYHYTLPIYAVISLILYLLATRLVQPTRRWNMRRKDWLVGIGMVLLLVVVIAGAFFATAPRYEWAKNPQAALPMAERAVAVPMAVQAVEREVVVVGEGTPTPTPAVPDGMAVLDENIQAAVYAAVARQLYTVDHTFGDQPPDWPVLYLVSVTDDGVGDPNAPQGEPRQLSENLRSKIADHLSDLPAKRLWIESREQAKIDPNNGAVEGGSGVIITVGNIHPQTDGTVHVSASLYFSALGAAGKTYILSNIDGTWTVTGTTGVEWIS